MKKRIALIICTLLLITTAVSASAAPYSNYTFNSDGDYFIEPPAMTPEVSYDYSYMIAGHPDEQNLRNVAPSAPQAFRMDEDGISFISDTGNNRLLMLDANFKVINVIREFTVPDAPAGAPTTFNRPIGVALHLSKLGETAGKKLLYVCDSENSRVVVFEYTDDGTVTCLKQYGEPAGLMAVISAKVTAAARPTPTPEPEEGEQEEELQPDAEPTEEPQQEEKLDKFIPLRVVVDSSDRVYLLVKGVYQGIVELNIEGGFSQFVAPAKVQESGSLFSRLFYTEEQLAFMQKVRPPEYSNITIDDDGFIYATISTLHFTNMAAYFNAGKNATDSGAPIRKLSLTGDDVLRRMGANPPGGDVIINKSNEKEGDVTAQDVYSRPNDVQAFKSGIYSILDYKTSKVFTYDTDGNLLFIFGISGKVFGAVQKASALQIMPDQQRMAILDEEIGQIVIYRPTEYAQLIFEANRLQSELNFDAANAKWDELLNVSSNAEIAYVGKGKFELNKGNYKEAMEYFRLGSDRENYSKALKEYRGVIIDRYLKWVLLGVVVLLVAWLLYALVRKYQNIGKEVKR